MSLVSSKLESDILSVFNGMDGLSEGGDKVFAHGIAKAVADFAESGVIVTVDVGGISAGVFAGSGSGSVKVHADVAENIIYAATVAMGGMADGGDDYLAAQIAAGVQAMMTAGRVETDVTGVATPPPPATPVPASGKGMGLIVCVHVPLEAGLKAAFKAMQEMSGGGNECFAAMMATAVDAYLKAGVVTTNGTGAVAGSVGSGMMS